MLNIQAMEIHQLQAVISKYPWFSYAREVLLCKLVDIEPECLESSYKNNLIFFPRREVVLLKCREAIGAIGKRVEEPVPVKDLLDVAADFTDEVDSFEIDFSQIQKEAESFASTVGAAEDVVVEAYDEIAGDESIDSFSPVSDVAVCGKSSEETRNQGCKIVVVGGDYFSKEDFAELDEMERAVEIRLGAPADNIDRDATEAVGVSATDFESMDFVTETLAGIYADQGYYDKAIEVYAKLILLYPEKSAYFASLVNEIKSKN